MSRAPEPTVYCPRCGKDVVTRREAFPRMVATAGTGWAVLVFLIWFVSGSAVMTAAAGVFSLLMLSAVVIAAGSALVKSCPFCGMTEPEMKRAADRTESRKTVKKRRSGIQRISLPAVRFSRFSNPFTIIILYLYSVKHPVAQIF